MASVYLETSFVSAHVSNRSDTASVYRRDVSQDWWLNQSNRHKLYVSDEVLVELSDRRFPHRDAALDLIKDLPILTTTPEVAGLASILVQQRVMPGPLRGDAFHVATAALAGIEYILSWNVRHLANPNKTQHLMKVCLSVGVVAPRIVTPDLLWEDDDETEG